MVLLPVVRLRSACATLVHLLNVAIRAARHVQRSFAAMDNRPPPPHVSPKGVWVSKLILRIFSAISCLVLIGLGAGITARWGYTYRGSSYAGYTLAAVAPPVRLVSRPVHFQPKTLPLADPISPLTGLRRIHLGCGRGHLHHGSTGPPRNPPRRRCRH